VTRCVVTLKLATSLDGRIAAPNGESRWITGPQARAAVHDMRAAHDAVLIGIGTALADDPLLTARTESPQTRQPVRVVLDSRLRLPLASALVRSIPEARLVVIGAEGASPRAADALRALGVEVHGVRAGPEGVAILAALERLADIGVGSVFVEGGGAIAGSFVKAEAVDRLEWFRAPIVLGADGAPAIGPLALQRLDEAPKYVRESVRAVGADLWETFVRQERLCSPAS
jgi:diaminohydroxyphosphoribosylaminopyrimidine deaminase/5-amino-6-(5-phosphoribosylamino)uracil reductase